MGRRTGSGRTPEQTTFALFYSGNFLTILQGVLRTAVAGAPERHRRFSPGSSLWRT